MRAIDSCISIQKNNPRHSQIKMLWELNPLLNCPFQHLFKPIENITLVDSDPYLNYFLLYRDKECVGIKKKIRKVLYSCLGHNYKYFDDISVQEFAYQPYYWNNSKNDFVIHSCIGFYSPDMQNASSFKPVQKLQHLIDQEVAKFIKPVTGLHIRRTDSIKSIAKSPTGLFLKHIEDSLAKDDNQLFFLATDDIQEENLFKSAFGNYILTQDNKDLSRDTQKGIEDALVDLYALSNTRLIVGSYWSSFSKTAAGLTKIPLQIIS